MPEKEGLESNQTLGLGLYDANVPYNVFTDQPSEIVIGLVGPLGTNGEKVRRLLVERLRTCGYRSEIISISSVIIPMLAHSRSIPETPKYDRSKLLIDLGNQIRTESKNKAVLAIAAAAEIARRRPSPHGPVQKVAYLISSLKLPEEVAELRKIYGRGFYLFAIHSDREQRMQHLSENGKAMAVSQAWELIDRDEHENSDYGQHTRDTFHLSDFFVADESNDDKLQYSIWRCIDLIFGNVLITPTFNEYAMFMAFSASLRSADLSRQVGAVIARGHEILSTGANDCPACGGGLYWPEFMGNRVDDTPRGRDFKRGGDSNVLERKRLIESIVGQFPENQRQFIADALERSSLRDLTEYGRVVHAEMEALLACARNNVSCCGATLFCTTFPCHNCAKHIIAGGIEEVIYVEPYPKSKAMEFHDDSITMGKLDINERKVRFKPFIGVGPRQFFDLFSLALSTGRKIPRKDSNGMVVNWDPTTAVPRVQMLPVAHRQFENGAVEYLKRLTGASNV